MSLNIGTQEFKAFLVEKLGVGTSIDRYEANSLGIDATDFEEEADGKPEIDINDLDGSGNVCAQLAALYKEQTELEAKDEETKKEEADRQRTTSGGGSKA